MITFCPHCGQKYDLPREYAGQQAACEVCGREFKIPFEQTAAVKLQVSPDVAKEKKNTNALMFLIVLFCAGIGVTVLGGRDAGAFFALILIGVIVIYGIIKTFFIVIHGIVKVFSKH